MMLTGRATYEHGVYDRLECEECGHEQSEPGPAKVREIACRRCGRRSGQPGQGGGTPPQSAA